MVESNNKNGEYNEDELHAPEWMNKSFFELVLCKYEGCDNVQVDKLEISPGSGKGDHYASIMFRAKVHYSTHKLNCDNSSKYKSLIIKTQPEQEGYKKDVLQEFSLFQTEIAMYSELLPKMEQLLKDAGDDIKLSAEMIYYSLTPRECIVFEDLVEKGYTVISNRECTLEEVYKAINIVAHIHAASTKLLEDGNTNFLQFRSAFTNDAFEKFDVMKNGMIGFKEVIREDEELKKYLPYIEKIETSIFDDIISYFEPEEIRKRGGILVLNHGDFHMKNMMVRYDNDTLQDIMMVDYQLSYYGSCAFDLLYAYTMLFGPTIRLNHREEVFSKYIEIYQETLKKLKYKAKIPTIAEFYTELKKYKHWELYLIMNFSIFYYTFLDGDYELGDVIENAEVRKKIMKKELALKEIRLQLKRLVKEGYFD